MQLGLESWEDGAPVKQQLKQLDRWAVQAAHKLIVTCGGSSVTIHQEPQMLSGKKMGVAAVSWDGSFVLASYLAGSGCHDRQGGRAAATGGQHRCQ